MCLVITVCALIGLWIRGFFGLIVGGVAGYVLGSLARAVVRRRLRQVQAQFIDTTFAVIGALCKADGVVTRDEIQVIEKSFARLQLSPEEMEAAKAAFNRGKAPDFELDVTVAKFAQSVPRGGILFQVFLQLLLLAVAADGQVHAAEHDMLVRVARGLGLAEHDVAQLEALLRAAANGPVTSSDVSSKQQLEDAYAALGVTQESDESEIKRAYRKMMSENHPDRIASKGLPESMREIADERAREINVAYDLIKRARNFG